MLEAVRILFPSEKTDYKEIKKAFIGLCIGACVYKAVANKYLHYVSDAYLYGRKPENIFYRFAGEWIDWSFDNKLSIANSFFWFVALIADSSRCLEQSVRVPNAIEELYRSTTGYNSLCKERIKLSDRHFTWIPASTKAYMYSHGSRIYHYSLNQAYRTYVLVDEMACLAAYIGDFLSTYMWTGESGTRSHKRVLINLEEAKKRFIDDPEGTKDLLKKNRLLTEKLLKSCGSTIDLDTYYSWIGSCVKAADVGNTALTPIRYMFNVAIHGLRSFAGAFIDFDLPKPTSENNVQGNFNIDAQPRPYTHYVNAKRGLKFD